MLNDTFKEGHELTSTGAFTFPPPPNNSTLAHSRSLFPHSPEPATSSVPQKTGFWDNIDNRRSFLLSFAESRGFDPMVEANWKGKSPAIAQNKV